MPTQFMQIAQHYQQSLFKYAPEMALLWGDTSIVIDKFRDYSAQSTEAWQHSEDTVLAALYAIDKQQMQGTDEYYTYLWFIEMLENKIASRLCKEELWDINPIFGWHNKMTFIAQKQPVGTAKNRVHALTCWKTFDKVVHQQIDNLNLGLNLGYTAPRPAVDRVIKQIDLLTDTPIERSPFFNLAERDGNIIFKAQISEIINQIVNPALKTYRDYLDAIYLVKTRDTIGIDSLPQGQNCYQAKLKQETTLTITPRRIHTIGLKILHKLSNEIAKIGIQHYQTKDIKAIFAKAKQDSMPYFSSEKEIIDYNFAALKRASVALPKWFDTIPKIPCIICPYPEHRAKTGAPGEYHRPNQKGTKPGTFFINTFDPPNRSRVDMEATLFHELLPGHHFQIALNYENDSLPYLNRFLMNAGYAEGWALYVERLADEMQLYSDDISKLGMFSNECLRAARMVIDTGIHSLGWSRSQSVDFLLNHTALDKNIAESEVDRYMMMPGQATSYMLGKLEIEKMRNFAVQQLEEHFDIKAFHSQILDHGIVSLPILKNIINQWVEHQLSKAKSPLVPR